jgi:hypothetical protein
MSGGKKIRLKDDLIGFQSLCCGGIVRTFRSDVILPFLGRLSLGLLTVEPITKANIGLVFKCFTAFNHN